MQQYVRPSFSLRQQIRINLIFNILCFFILLSPLSANQIKDIYTVFENQQKCLTWKIFFSITKKIKNFIGIFGAYMIEN